jgi:hypothetical protein
MPKAEEGIRIFGEDSAPQLQREIFEIESKLKSDGPELHKRAIELLKSRLYYLGEKLEELNKNS